ncbi:glycosyltransferase family 4 protein [Winogradskyella vincentii]|uniref:Glycosyltransferase family 4 protein n=1 Tax=Winogradskyella vincentii TaxID=2877122 RepID=A0ABS7XZF9_9FLAO|nr:glycosyltransferase family 4 protein [Winogradskyella vincentii]MCA0151873.1 glycosyltransferase family 4 protein [Winogradskyella vincentii]
MRFNKYDLAVISPGYSHYNFHFIDELNKLSVRGYNIKVVFIRGIRENTDFYSYHNINDNLVIKSCNFKGLRVNHYSLFQALNLFLILLKTLVQSKSILTSTQAPLHSKFAYIISRLLIKRLAIIVEQWEDYETKSFFMKSYKQFGYYLIKTAHTVFVHGKAQENFVSDFLKRKKRVEILPFLSKSTNTNKNFGKNRNIITILYFGRITEQKGLDILIQAYNLISTNQKTKLLICGGVDENFFWESEESKNFLKYCKELAKTNQSIVFKGHVKPEQKDEFFGQADIFVHPHKLFKNKSDGWGLVVNEALSNGLPIIITNRVGSATTLVKHNKNGYIIEPSDINQLKRKLEVLIENEDLRKNFSNFSLDIFKEYHKPSRQGELIESFILKK